MKPIRETGNWVEVLRPGRENPLGRPAGRLTREWDDRLGFASEGGSARTGSPELRGGGRRLGGFSGSGLRVSSYSTSKPSSSTGVEVTLAASETLTDCEPLGG